MRRLRVAVPLLALLSLHPAAEDTNRQRLLVIVPASQTITDISVVDLRRIYLAQMTRWPNRHRIIPVIPPTSSHEGQLFLKRVVQMADLDYAQYWIGAVFRGASTSAPIVASSAAEAKRFLGSEPDAIAVVGDALIADKTIRVLSVDGKPPDASDYPLAR